MHKFNHVRWRRQEHTCQNVEFRWSLSGPTHGSIKTRKRESINYSFCPVHFFWIRLYRFRSYSSSKFRVEICPLPNGYNTVLQPVRALTVYSQHCSPSFNSISLMSIIFPSVRMQQACKHQIRTLVEFKKMSVSSVRISTCFFFPVISSEDSWWFPRQHLHNDTHNHAEWVAIDDWFCWHPMYTESVFCRFGDSTDSHLSDELTQDHEVIRPLSR